MSEEIIVNALKDELMSRNIKYREEVLISPSRADIVVKENIAIEAKISNIKKGIFQLISYRQKYKKCFLYMPYEKKGLVEKHKHVLEKLNIKWFYFKKNNKFQFGKYHWKKILFD